MWTGNVGAGKWAVRRAWGMSGLSEGVEAGAMSCDRGALGRALVRRAAARGDATVSRGGAGCRGTSFAEEGVTRREESEARAWSGCALGERRRGARAKGLAYACSVVVEYGSWRGFLNRRRRFWRAGKKGTPQTSGESARRGGKSWGSGEPRRGGVTRRLSREAVGGVGREAVGKSWERA